MSIDRAATRDDAVHLFVSSFFMCSFVACEMCVKSFATWQHLTVGGRLSYRLRYTCLFIEKIIIRVLTCRSAVCTVCHWSEIAELSVISYKIA